MAKNILVTGAAGLVGQRLLARLVDDASVDKIWALDLKKGPLDHPSIAWQHADISAAWPEPPFKIHQVVHLAFALNPMKDLEREKTINLQGTNCFLDFLSQHKIGSAVTCSSGTAYGAHEDNPAQLRESDPLRADPAFPYAYHKRVMEERIEGWRKEGHKTALGVLRPCILMSPEVDNYISRTIARRIPPAVLGQDPPMQFVHSEDVARACKAILDQQADGPFNIAGEGTLGYQEALKLAGGRPLAVPQAVLQPFADLAWKAGILEGPAGMADFLIHSWVMDTSRLERELGFKFLYTSEAAFLSWVHAQLRERKWI